MREEGVRAEPRGPETDGSLPPPSAAFLALCRRHGLPQPEVNARVGQFTVDFLWRDQRLAVETDGYRAHRAHRGRQTFGDDREGELELGLLGIRVLRFTGSQMRARPARVAAAVDSALGLGPG